MKSGGGGGRNSRATRNQDLLIASAFNTRYFKTSAFYAHNCLAFCRAWLFQLLVYGFIRSFRISFGVLLSFYCNVGILECYFNIPISHLEQICLTKACVKIPKQMDNCPLKPPFTLWQRVSKTEKNPFQTHASLLHSSPEPSSHPVLELYCLFSLSHEGKCHF